MNTPTAVMARKRAKKISDRAFRILYVLAVEMDPGWVPLSKIAKELEMTSHQIRLPAAELRAASIVQYDRRYETGESGRKTWHTYLCLVDDTTEAAA